METARNMGRGSNLTPQRLGGGSARFTWQFFIAAAFKFTCADISVLFRLILTTVLITSKFFNDIYFANQYIASVGGVPTVNLNQLENFFLEMIDWNLYISPEDFEKFDGYAIELALYSEDKSNTTSPAAQSEPGQN